MRRASRFPLSRTPADALLLPPPHTHSVEYSPFFGIEKSAVLQEARCFNDAHVDARKCAQVITKLLYLLTQGEVLTKVRSVCVCV